MARILFLTGITLVLIGLCPIAFAIGVDSNVSDEPGAVVNGQALIRAWYSWAFSAQFVGPLIVGTISSIAGVILVPTTQREQLITRALAAIGILVLVSACSSGWLLF